MSVPSAILLGLAMGVVFGFALEKSRVFEPGIIVGQMQMRNFTMLKIFLSAVTTGLLVLVALDAFGVKMHPKATIFAADIVGGLILGAGISLAGACPGTVLAQVGVGYRDAWMTLAGGLAGALTFGYLEPSLSPILSANNAGALTLNGLSGLPFAAIALPFAALLIIGLIALERWRPWRGELGRNVDGLTDAPGSAEPELPIMTATAR